jgi:hypothetical protein
MNRTEIPEESFTGRTSFEWFALTMKKLSQLVGGLEFFMLQKILSIQENLRRAMSNLQRL